MFTIAKIDDLVSNGDRRWSPFDCKHPLLYSGQRIKRVYAARWKIAPKRNRLLLIGVYSAAKIDHPICYSRISALNAIALFIYLPFLLPITAVEGAKATIAHPYKK